MKKNYTDVLLEDMNHKFDLLLEAIAPLKDMQKDIFALKEDLEEVKQDVKVVKAAVTDLSKQVHGHERRFTKLKTA
jgi:hypothetical protein